METLHIHTDNGADKNKNCLRAVMSTVSESTVNEATINNSENDIPNESPNTDRRKSCFEFKIPSHPSVFMTRCYTLEFIRNTNLKITDAEEAKASILSSSVTVESTKQNMDFANGDHLLKEDSNCKPNADNPNSTSNDSDIICLDDLINETNCRAEWFEDDFGEEIARNDAITGEFDGYDYPHYIPMLESLNEKFGLESFKENQMQLINATLSRHDCFVLMPTGGGKSLCYQLPAILTPGVTIVVSPLKSLILDQVDKLKSLDIPSAHLTGDVTEARSYEIYKDLERLEPIIKLLYMTSRFNRTTY